MTLENLQRTARGPTSRLVAANLKLHSPLKGCTGKRLRRPAQGCRRGNPGNRILRGKNPPPSSQSYLR
jgi:hypothetical protein